MEKQKSYCITDGNGQTIDLENLTVKEIEDMYSDFKKQAVKYDALQSLNKTMLNNGAYGYMGWEFGTFNYYTGAAMITEWGRVIIRLMVDFANSFGNNTIRLDTDGALTILPLSYSQDKEGEDKFVQDMNDYVNEKFLILYNQWKEENK
jgi:DNA polymerase elongation subunit (family B)